MGLRILLGESRRERMLKELLDKAKVHISNLQSENAKLKQKEEVALAEHEAELERYRGSCQNTLQEYREECDSELRDMAGAYQAFDGIVESKDRKERLDVFGVTAPENPVLLAVLGILKEMYEHAHVMAQAPDCENPRYHNGGAAWVNDTYQRLRREFALAWKRRKRREKRKDEREVEVAE